MWIPLWIIWIFLGLGLLIVTGALAWSAWHLWLIFLDRWLVFHGNRRIFWEAYWKGVETKQDTPPQRERRP